MSVVSNLFPPIVKDVENAFIRNGDCNIYFSLSSFNSYNDIKHVQVTLINQKTNQSAFKTNLYPLGIKFISSISIVSNPTDDFKYYITIANEDVINNIFELNQFYKIQIRFGDINLSQNPDSTWINDNIDHFSEWSQVCLIKGISQPTVEINQLIQQISLPIAVAHKFTSFVGKLSFAEVAETETLKSYNIILKDSHQDVIINSGQIITNQYHPNNFAYQVKRDLQYEPESYTLYFNYTTINGYKATASFPFYIQYVEQQQLNATIEVTPDEQRGMMKIDIAFKPMFATDKTLIIKRTSSTSSFLEWEDIKQLKYDGSFRHLWYDTAIESGTWYKYRIQQYRDQLGSLVSNGKISAATDPIICTFDDIFLTCGDTQLKVQFNPNVADLKYNVNESQQATLGAQYPYIKRNGNNYYRSFSVGGLISSLSDEMNWYDSGYNENGNYFYDRNISEPFTSKEELYDTATDLYEGYNATNNINQYHDYIYQREFRQKVMEFLYKNNVKLFRSLTQGNILIKLTNITLSPISTIGRMLYSFSAAATQIDKYTAENLAKYNIINKFYYTYSTLSINDTFEGERSLITRFYELLPILQKKVTDIMQLDFEYDGPENIVIYTKPKHNTNFIRHILQNGELTLKYSDSDPIADAYFWGIHISSDDYTETNQYYYSTEDITNPQNYYVYYIIDESVYLIDNYVQYYNEAGILATYPEEIVSNQTNPNEHSLLVEPLYYKMIYYNGEWYPFSENQDIMLRQLDVAITYTYRIKKED